MAVARHLIRMEDALDEAAEQIKEVLRRNQILIDYWIYPNRPPTAIADYEPMIKLLQSRVKNLKRLSYPNCRLMLDKPDTIAAHSLIQILNQLQDAIIAFEKLIKEHYDPGINRNGASPYSRLEDRLKDLRNKLFDLEDDARDHPRHAETEPWPRSPRLCKGAILLINGFNSGELAPVKERELLADNKRTIRAHQGFYLWWLCTSCDFRLRFHVREARYNSLETNDEIREHSGIPLEYRSIYMAKSHLYSPNFGDLKHGEAKYACVFCFGQGRQLERGVTTFATGKELATHFCSVHKRDLPPSMLLKEFAVGVNNQLAEGVRRFQLNLHTT